MALRTVAPARTARLARSAGRGLPHGSFACDPDRAGRSKARRCARLRRKHSRTFFPHRPNARPAALLRQLHVRPASVAPQPDTNLTREAQTIRVIVRFWLRMIILLVFAAFSSIRF